MECRRHAAEIHAEYSKLKGTRREKKISDIAIEKCGFYDRVLFREKYDNVFYVMLDYASNGRKWVA